VSPSETNLKFKDLFSDRAALYATYRPLYPDSLFARLAALTREHRVALDCGTGNGQAAIGLANHFERVIGIDPSADQISRATPNQQIEYRVATADSSGLPDASVDLVAAAQSLHWFDAPAFFSEARRVLTPGGAIAVWGYGDPILDTASLNGTLHAFNRGTLERYWHPERQLLLDGYRTIPFPFDEVGFPPMVLEMRWTLAELTGYLRTWSAVASYVAERGFDPIVEIERSLSADWGDARQPRLVRWPLYIRAGRVPEPGLKTKEQG
jgi:SAM-dependent methyltransferase